MVAPDMPPAPLPGQREAWTCRFCPALRWFFGWVYHGRTLVEPDGSRSTLPCLRTCRRCGRTNLRLPG